MQKQASDCQRGPALDQKLAVFYTRVSTTKRVTKAENSAYEQDPEVQERPLRSLISQRGWGFKGAYSDRASGTSDKRPGLQSLMEDARRGSFDVVVVWRFDRFARSVRQLVNALEEFRVLGIDFVSHQEALDTSTPMGKAMFAVIGAMAELERDVIRERVVAGLDHARRSGTKSGRAIGRPRIIARWDRIVELRSAGWSWARISQETGVSESSVRRIAAAARSRGAKTPTEEAL